MPFAVVPSGTQVIDDLIGGLVARQTSLLTGGPRSGKTWFTLSYLRAALARGERCCLIPLEQPEEVLALARRYLRWDMRPFLEDRQLTMLSVARSFTHKIAAQGTPKAPLEELAELVHRRTIEHLLFDTIDPLLSSAHVVEVKPFVRELLRGLSNVAATVLVTSSVEGNESIRLCAGELAAGVSTVLALRTVLEAPELWVAQASWAGVTDHPLQICFEVGQGIVAADGTLADRSPTDDGVAARRALPAADADGPAALSPWTAHDGQPPSTKTAPPPHSAAVLAELSARWLSGPAEPPPVPGVTGPENAPAPRSLERFAELLQSHGAGEPSAFEVASAFARTVSELLATVPPADPAVVRARARELGLEPLWRTMVEGTAPQLAPSDRYQAACAFGSLFGDDGAPALLSMAADATVPLEHRRAALGSVPGGVLAKCKSQLRELVPRLDAPGFALFAPMLKPLLLQLASELERAVRAGRDDEARAAALELWGAGGGPAAIANAEAMLGDVAEAVRAAACQVLQRTVKPELAPRLLALGMNDPAERVRRAAARGLRRFADPQRPTDSASALLAPVRQALQNDADPLGQERGAELAGIAALPVAEELERLLESHVQRASAAAARALGELGRIAVWAGALDSTPDSAERQTAGPRLRRIATIAPELLLPYLSHVSFRVRVELASALGVPEARGCEPLVDALTALLADPAWPVRARALESLAVLAPVNGIGRIERALGDPEEVVRVAAARAAAALAETADPEQRLGLLPLFESTNVEVRRTVVRVCGSVADPRVDGMLTRAALDSAQEVREAATAQMATSGAARYEQALVERLADSSLAVKCLAVKGLGALGSPSAVRALLSQLGQRDRALREAVTEVLSARGVVELASLVRQRRQLSVDGRIALAWALGKTAHSDAVGPIAELLQDASAEVRAAAVGALAKLDGERVSTMLRDRLGDPNERVRAAAINGVMRQGGAGDCARLCALLKDPDAFVRRRACVAVGYLGQGAAALDALDQAMGRADETAEQYAVLIGYGLIDGGHGLEVVIHALMSGPLGQGFASAIGSEAPWVQARFRRNLGIPDDAPEPLLPLMTPEGLLRHFTLVLCSSESPEQRVGAIRGLRMLRSPDFVELLAGSASRDPDPTVRANCIQGLSAVAAQSEAALHACQRGLLDPAIDVQRASVRALRDAQATSSNQPLLSCFSKLTTELWDEIAATLVAINQARPQELIDAMMGFDEEPVLRGAVEVLGQIADPCAGSLLTQLGTSPYPAVQVAATRALSRLRQEVLGPAAQTGGR